MGIWHSSGGNAVGPIAGGGKLAIVFAIEVG